MRNIFFVSRLLNTCDGKENEALSECAYSKLMMMVLMNRIATEKQNTVTQRDIDTIG